MGRVLLESDHLKEHFSSLHLSSRSLPSATLGLAGEGVQTRPSEQVGTTFTKSRGMTRTTF